MKLFSWYRLSFGLGFAVALIVNFSCTSPNDELVPEPRPVTAFEGTPDEKFAATWKTTDGMSTYVLEKDGKYKLDSTIPVRGQSPIRSKTEGEWRIKDGRMLFKDPQGNVVPYALKLEGDTLELSLTGRMKAKTVLKKQ